MSNDNVCINVAIIGGGCAGLSAALYCARAELKPIVFCGELNDKGGLLIKTSIVENYPGFSDGILGFDLIEQMQRQAVKYGAILIDSEIVKVDFDDDHKYKVLTDNEGRVYKCLSVIIATGSKPNKLYLPNEENLWSKGISSCAVCDGALYKNKRIAVIGGGDTAMEEALFLTKFSNVLLIHRGNSFRASKSMQSRVLNNPKIKIMYNTVVTKLHGTDYLTGITCETTHDGVDKNNKDIDIDGLFYGIGLKPNSKVFNGVVETDEEGYIRVVDVKGYTTATSGYGIFVAGDVHDKQYKQAVVACGDGCKAAMDAIHFCDNADK